MYRARSAGMILAAAALLALVGCAGVKPVPYSGLTSSQYLQPNRSSDSSRIPYAYSSSVKWSNYAKAIVDPVEIYRASDNQFGDLADADKSELAAYMQKTFAQKLATRFAPATQPGAGTLRIKLILTGAETTTPFLGQFTHFDIGGNVYNAVAASTGGKSAFGGSVSYAVEIYDSGSGRLLDAYITKQYPNAMNLTASFGSLGAARTGIDKGADALVSRLH